MCVHARARKCESAAALLAPAHCIEYVSKRISHHKHFQDREAEGAEATGGAATGAHGTRGKGIKLSHARTLARTHSHTRTRTCTRTHTHIAQARRQRERGAAREINAEQHSQHTAACACIRSQDMRMHRARACLACVRRPVVGSETRGSSIRDARLRQGNARERRVVALRRTVVIIPRWVAAQIQPPVQRRHPVRRASTAHHPPPRMPTATTPEARQTPRPQSASALPHALVHARAHL